MGKKKFIALVGVAVVVVAVLVVVVVIVVRPGGAARPSGTASSAGGSVETSSAVVDGKIDGHDTVGDYGMKIGQKAQVGSLELTVIKAELGPKDDVGNATTAITVSVHNLQATRQAIDAKAWSAIDRNNGDVPLAKVAGNTAESLNLAPHATVPWVLFFESGDIGRVVYSADDANATQLTWLIQ